MHGGYPGSQNEATIEALAHILRELSSLLAFTLVLSSVSPIPLRACLQKVSVTNTRGQHPRLFVTELVLLRVCEKAGFPLTRSVDISDVERFLRFAARSISRYPVRLAGSHLCAHRGSRGRSRCFEFCVRKWTS